METIKRLIAKPTTFTFLSLLLIGLLIAVGRECDLSKSDWGTWVGSIGTVGTLIGAILIATNDHRIATRKELALAKIAIASFEIRIASVISDLSNSIYLIDVFSEEKNIENLKIAEEFIKTADIWRPEETRALIAIIPDQAVSLARACSIMDGIRRRISSENNAKLFGEADAKIVVANEQTACKSLMADLEMALNSCRDASASISR